MVGWLGPIIGIVLVDMVLSADNAVVIGAAAANLPSRLRLTAIVLGGGGAILLRILFSLAATVLLQLPYLGVVGGIILLVIAINILTDRGTILSHSKEKTSLAGKQISTGKDIFAPEATSKSFLTAILTILLADVTMSLDNVLAIAGLAGGNLIFLVIGLALSIMLLLAVSALVAVLIARLPWLLDIACLIIGWTAVNLFLGDDTLRPFFLQFPWVNIVAYGVATIIILVVDVYLQKQVRKRSLQATEI